MLKFIVDDILESRQKHTLAPQFIVKNKIMSIDTLNTWTGLLEEQGRWIKYKHVQDDIFELKSFFPEAIRDGCFETLSFRLNYALKDAREMAIEPNVPDAQRFVYFAVALQNPLIWYTENQIRPYMENLLWRGDNLHFGKPQVYFDRGANRFNIVFSVWCFALELSDGNGEGHVDFGEYK